jgi:hypothetical protein
MVLYKAVSALAHVYRTEQLFHWKKLALLKLQHLLN